jgi:type IV pilus assembly protein PilO
MALQDTIDQIQNIDFSDTDKIGVWPMPVRAFIWVLVFGLFIGATWWFFIRDMNNTLRRTQMDEVTLRSDFEKKAHEAANLEDYRAQMVAMDEQFQGLLARLPTDIELPGLIDDIAEKAEDSGLTLSRREFLAETKKEFIVEKPLQIVVRGNTYHDLGGFVSGIAGMPRIVTLHDFTVGPVGGERRGSGGGLQMNITAKTYRYSVQGQ